MKFLAVFSGFWFWFYSFLWIVGTFWWWAPWCSHWQKYRYSSEQFYCWNMPDSFIDLFIRSNRSTDGESKVWRKCNLWRTSYTHAMKNYIYKNLTMKKREHIHCEFCSILCIPFLSRFFLSLDVILLFHRDAIDPVYYCLFLTFFPHIPQALLKLFLLRLLAALPSSFSVPQLRPCFVRIFPSEFFFQFTPFSAPLSPLLNYPLF